MTTTTSTHSKAKPPRLLIEGFIKIILQFRLILSLMVILLRGNPLLNEIVNISG